MFGVEAGITGHHHRYATKTLLVHLDRGNQQVFVVRSLLIHFISNDDLVLDLLNPNQFAKFDGFTGLTLADDFRSRLDRC